MKEASATLGHHKPAFDLPGRLRAGGIHLGISLVVAAAAAAAVFGLWYPHPYREISGGRELFVLLVSVDVVLGPLLTLAIFNRAKPRAELRRDLGVVAALQLAALVYGLWTVAVARPVHLVFEIDRLRVVHALDVPVELMPRVPPGITALPWTGPTLLAVRPFTSEQEKLDATIAALQGLSLSARPDLWQGYEDARPAVLAAARPVTDLLKRFPAQAAEVDKVLREANLAREQAVYLPMVGRKSFWTAFLDARSAQVLAFLPIDSF